MNSHDHAVVSATTSNSILSIICLLILPLLGSCGGGHSSARVTTGTASLGASVKNLQIQAGVPQEITFTYTIPGDITTRGDVSVNVARTLRKGQLE